MEAASSTAAGSATLLGGSGREERRGEELRSEMKVDDQIHSDQEQAHTRRGNGGPTVWERQLGVDGVVDLVDTTHT